MKGIPMNIVILHGVLSRELDVRELPSGDRVAAFDVTVRDEGLDTEVVPISWLSPTPAALDRLVTGTEVVVTGRVRRRWFRAGGATQSRTEVQASIVVPSRQARKAQQAVDDVLDEVAEWLSP
jgi:single-strand DNA-binding protein